MARHYSLGRAIRLLAERPIRAVIAVLVAGAALAVPLTAFMVAQALPAGGLLPSAEVSVFATPGTSASDLKVLAAKVGALDGVAAAKVVTREQAWAELQRRSPGLQALPESRLNALPDIVIAEFAAGTAPGVIEAAVAAAGKLPRAESVQADLGWYRRITMATRAISRSALPVALLAGALLSALVLGAVRLTAVLESEELKVLDAVGADADFVRRPSAYAGAAVLGLSAAVAIGIGTLLRVVADPALTELGREFGLELAFRLPPASLLVAFFAAAVLTGAASGLYFAGRARRRAMALADSG